MEKLTNTPRVLPFWQLLSDNHDKYFSAVLAIIVLKTKKKNGIKNTYIDQDKKTEGNKKTKPYTVNICMDT